jgi:hypothetical protein
MSPSRISIPVRPDEAKALLDLAQQQYRDPRRQAALLVREGLQRAGVLPAEPTLSDHRPPAAVEAGK